jgi:hypothetical protein
VEASLLRVEDIPREAIVRLQPQRAKVQHRHLGIDPSGRLSAFQPSYCEGELSVSVLGDIQYVCTETDSYRKRCERGFFIGVREVRLREGGLRITMQDGSNWDFFGDASNIRALYESLSAVVAQQPRQ